mgnify:CR=1 FL=1
MVARYIGAGPYYAVAQEGGLKIAEAASIAALAYEQEEFYAYRNHTDTKGCSIIFDCSRRCTGKANAGADTLVSVYSDYVILIANHSHPLKDSKALLCHFSR